MNKVKWAEKKAYKLLENLKNTVLSSPHFKFSSVRVTHLCVIKLDQLDLN